MIKLETNEEKKKYILEHFKTSSGARITEMLKRYYASLKEEEPLYVTAEKIFNQPQTAPFESPIGTNPHN